MTVTVDTPSTVRAFGLHETGSHSIQMAYAHHFESHTTTVSTQLTLPKPKVANGRPFDVKSCRAEWLDPETGDTAPAFVASASEHGGGVTYSSPHFEVDVALVVIC